MGEGIFVDAVVGFTDGVVVGALEGATVGHNDGIADGRQLVGGGEGHDGLIVGNTDVVVEGTAVGRQEGVIEGDVAGDCEGGTTEEGPMSRGNKRRCERDQHSNIIVLPAG